ncbi:hypothetical protein [Kibdelosporangium aridum]|uniref:hypothetical protein n=1 Tax=Kibdelosporangium aridum TaxID=2030 RepID=UPI0035F067A2
MVANAWYELCDRIIADVAAAATRVERVDEQINVLKIVKPSSEPLLITCGRIKREW